MMISAFGCVLSPQATLVGCSLLPFVLILNISSAAANENRWGFGNDLGLTTGTVDNTVFTLGFNLENYPDPKFSIGPVMQISPMGDFFQISIAGVGRYHIRFNNRINLVPYAGIGLIRVDLDKGTGPGSIDRNDTSWLIPIGLSLEYQAHRNFGL